MCAGLGEPASPQHLPLLSDLPFALPANRPGIHRLCTSCKGVCPMRSRCHARITRWLPRHRRRRRCLRVVLMFPFMVGVAAFVFSAVSPDDDDIQQEFVQQKSAHCSRINKQISKTRVTHLRGKRKIASALLLISSVFPRREWQPSVVTAASTSVAIFASVRRDRSPPVS
jgi:hypothetical protein